MNQRFLVYHPESDCLFEVPNSAELDQALLFGECNEVTDIPEFEERFAKEKQHDTKPA